MATDPRLTDPAALLEEDLAPLVPRMGKALELRRRGEDAAAARLLREILQVEPRLAEPRLELAHLAALAEDWEEAEAQARLAASILRSGGQWTTDLEPGQLLAFALNLLGEVIVRPLEEGDLLLFDRPSFEARWNEAAALFCEAAEADPANEDARRNRGRYPSLG